MPSDGTKKDLMLLTPTDIMTDELQDGIIKKTEELIEDNKGPEATEEAQELVDLKPEEAIAWFMKGKALYVEEKFEESLACLSKAAELNREQPEVWQMLGYCLISLNRMQEALQALEYVKTADPKNAEAIYALGIAYVLLGDVKNAKENVNLAYSVDATKIRLVANNLSQRFISPAQGVSQGAKVAIERILMVR